ncbi:MAG: response regulator transcription factor [Acidobacteriota bacterium]
MPIRILLADDSALYRQSLRRSLQSYTELEVVGEASSGEEAVRLVRQHHPDVAILDIRMAPLNGIDAIPKILRDSRETAVLMLTMHGDRRYVIRSVEAGARGYLLKDCEDEMLVRAIRSVSEGKTFFSPQVAQYLPDRSRATSHADP